MPGAADRSRIQSMLQLLLHLTGDYLLQSDHMSRYKRSSSVWAGFHAIVYSLPFWLLHPSWVAWAVICGSHFLIDRFGLARYLVWAKNILFGMWPNRLFGNADDPDDESEDDRSRLAWKNCKATGYPADLQPWLAVMLLIVADNTLHLSINYASLRWL